MSSTVACECGNSWKVNTKAYVSLNRWIMAHRTVQRCTACGDADKLKIVKEVRMKQVCPAGPVTKGIDIYHGDYISDMDQVLASGVSYVLMKAWENAEDPSFASRWAAMGARKVIRGAYDFFHPERDPVQQAISFLGTFGGVLGPGDLPCALDFEVADGVGSKALLNGALQWLQYVETHTGKTPILYMSPGFVNLDARFTKYPIWIANYGVTCPHVPDAVPNWKFWQGSESGLVPGMRGVCDMDVFNGSLTDLQTFAGLVV